MTDPQRWVWTEHGMEPYRAHPLMPDVGGVFVQAEDCQALEGDVSEIERFHWNEYFMSKADSGRFVYYADHARILAAKEARLVALEQERDNLRLRIAEIE